MILRIILASTLIASGLAAGCGGLRLDAVDGSDQDRRRVLPARVRRRARSAGTHVDVTNLTPAGAEPHDLELAPRDVGRVRGRRPRALLGRRLSAAARGRCRAAAIAFCALLDTPGLRAPADGDPHVWLDPVRFARSSTRIGAALGPPGRGRRARGRLRALDREYRRASRTARGARSSRATPPSATSPSATASADPDHRASTPEAEPTPRRSRASVVDHVARERRDDRLLRAARLAAARRDRRARGRRDDRRARPDRGPDRRRSSDAARTTSRSCARTSRALRKALGCR